MSFVFILYIDNIYIRSYHIKLYQIKFYYITYTLDMYIICSQPGWLIPESSKHVLTFSMCKFFFEVQGYHPHD